MITTSREERCQMNLPNKLTVARVIAVPFFIALYMTGYFLPALILFIAGGLSVQLQVKLNQIMSGCHKAAFFR